jgi:hypothetical protein
LRLFAQFLDFAAGFDGSLGNVEVGAFRSDGIELAVDLLQQKIEAFSGGFPCHTQESFEGVDGWRGGRALR